jgi:hypothetical protein
MAIVFISPPRRQRILIFSVIGFFVLAIAVIALDVYLTKPQAAQTEEYFTAPAIKINWSILESDQLTNLEPVPAIDKDFQFSAKDANGAPKSGFIYAASDVEATQMLKNLSLTSIALNELKPGRPNPFTPYYKVGAPVNAASKPSAK